MAHILTALTTTPKGLAKKFGMLYPPQIYTGSYQVECDETAQIEISASYQSPNWVSSKPNCTRRFYVTTSAAGSVAPSARDASPGGSLYTDTFANGAGVGHIGTLR